MDGARLANAIAALGKAPSEITWKAGVDILCLGGAKIGLPLGEAILFFNKDLATDFAYRCKQAGQLASKMRFLTAPWLGVLNRLGVAPARGPGQRDGAETFGRACATFPACNFLLSNGS